MKTNNLVITKKVVSIKEMHDAFCLFKSYFPNVFSDEEKIITYASKILNNGVCFVCYFKNETCGFYTGYANDKKTKQAYGSLFAVSKECGLLRGIIYKELFYHFSKYAQENGMKYVVGECRNDNINAIKQYERIGFKRKDVASPNSTYIIANIETILSKLKSY